MRDFNKLILAFCLIVFAGFSLATAQNAQEPSSDMSIQKLEMLQTQQLNADPANDEEQLAAEANITPDEPATVNLNAALLEHIAEMEGYGYEAIPGFTFTGSENTDAENWNNALEALKDSDPQRYQQIIDNQ